MCRITPLKSSIGQPAEGDDKYFYREKIVNKILRKLDNGENVLLSAPRRIGKSSILKHIKNNTAVLSLFALILIVPKVLAVNCIDVDATSLLTCIFEKSICQYLCND